MSDAITAEREKELGILLDRIRTHPTADLSRERERAALLTRLIGARTPAN